MKKYPVFNLNIECFCKDSVDFSDKFNGFNLLLCEDMLSQENQIHRSLKKYFTKYVLICVHPV